MNAGATIAALSPPDGARVLMNGREVLMLGSNNYLGLANHPVVVQAAVDAIRTYGLGTCINPCFLRTPVHRQLEQALAAFLGTEDAILFASCSAANAGVLATLVGDGDAIFSDQSNHASIIDGCRLGRAKAIVYPYRDVASLRTAMAQESPRASKLVITDGVFSMEGEVAPLEDLLAATRAFAATLVVDDSHAVGVIGPSGRGSVAAAGLDARDVVTTGTFSKALGGAAGGFAAGPFDVIAELRSRSRAFIFTAGMSVPDAAGALAALRLLGQSDEHVDRLRINAEALRGLLAEGGIPTASAESPITPLHVGDAERAKAIHEWLLDRGVYVPAMVFPIVPRDRALLRVQASAAMSREDVEFAARSILLGFEEFPA